MIITVTSHKGGVGKTTTAIHLAAYLQRLAPTLLVDGDAIRSATKWSQRGGNTGLPFKVVTHAQLVNHVHEYKNGHVIIDTEGNPTDDDFRDLATNCDLLVIKTHRVLLTMVPPKPRTDGQQLRDMLVSERIPVFNAEIPRLAAFEKAAAEGVPVYSVKEDRNAPRAWDAYEAAGKEIIDG
jgi:chromosome partitioning protein